MATTVHPDQVGTDAELVRALLGDQHPQWSALSAVLDGEALGPGGPACDLQPAWHLFTGARRQRLREALAVDDATWARGRGTVVHQSVTALPCCWRTDPGVVEQSWHALHAVLAQGGA